MSYTVSLQQRIQQLKKAQANLPEILCRVAKDSTMRAIEEATAATPPKEGTGRGAHIGRNTVTGQFKAHWGTDSKTKPRIEGNRVTTELNNNMDYASYVDQGHRMDRHFVPGLYIDENGQLARNVDGKGGLVVGTKTKYVKGEFMADKAKEAYQKTVLVELDKEIRRLLK